jgi:hypothetical protein
VPRRLQFDRGWKRLIREDSLDLVHLFCSLIICEDSLGIQRANRLDVSDFA